MARIIRAELALLDLKPPRVRTDAVQSFISQETPVLRLVDADGAVGTGYSYTIGSGGSSVVALLRDRLLPELMGQDGDRVEQVWTRLRDSVRALTVGTVSSLALAAVDTALWDLRCRRAGLPLHVAAGGAAASRPVYTTEGGWLHLSQDALVDDALAAREAGFAGAKVKVGRPSGAEDRSRVAAIRTAVGDGFELMVDANQSLTRPEAVRRANSLADLDLAWLEEPLPADDVTGHAGLARTTSIPIAVGESLYSLSQFREYLQADAAGVVQVDVARVGGVTPWLKVAHLAEAFGVPVCPHFLMEVHVSLACAVPNGRWVEHIPQLESVTTGTVRIEAGQAYAPTQPGLGVEWDSAAIDRERIGQLVVIEEGVP